MPKPLRIAPVALDSTNRMVLKVAIDLINDEGFDCELLPDNSLQGEVLVIDTDNELGQQLLTEASDHQMKLVISQERLQGKNIVWQEPPVRVIDMKELLLLICRPMMVTAARQEAREPTASDDAATHADQQPAEIAPTSFAAAEETRAQETDKSTQAVTDMPGLESSLIEEGDIESPAAESLQPEAPAPQVEISETEAPVIEDAVIEDAAELTPEEPISSQSLFLILLNARQQKTCQQISFGEYRLFIGGHNGTLAVSHEQNATDVLMLPFDELHIEQIDAVAFDMAAQDLHISALDNLLWRAGVDHSDGRLLEGHSLKQAVRLKAWPNFTRNGFRQSHFKLAAIMARQPISLEDLGKQADVPEKDVISFYNSAYAVGLIDRTTNDADSPIQKTPPRTRRKGLLGMLARKLGFR